jgi:hypothetical protein
MMDGRCCCVKQLTSIGRRHPIGTKFPPSITESFSLKLTLSEEMTLCRWYLLRHRVFTTTGPGGR